MPTNVSVDYALAQQEFLKARTSAEKLAALKKMISTAPKHKSAEKLNAQLKRRLADLKKDIIKEKKSGKGKSFSIRKEGAATVVFLGVAGSNKTKVFCELSGTNYKKDNDYAPEMRMIRFENVWLQGIDLPAIYAGFAGSPQAGQIFDLIRTADFLVFVCKSGPELDLMINELAKKDFEINSKPYVYINFIDDAEEFKKNIWQSLKKIRVQTKTRGIVAEKPLVLKEGATVRELAETVHKDFVRKFRHAKVWGPSARFAGQQVGLEHELKDNDVIEIFMK